MTRKQQLKLWQDARFGLFIPWGLYSIPAKGEWVMYQERIPVREYEKLAARFNPVNFNADEWVRTAKDAGMKYIVITAKHHDGFSMFKTQVSPFNIVDATPFGRDILHELAEACRREDMKLGFYYSHVRDWHDPRAQSFEAQGRPDRWGNYGNFWDYPSESTKNLQAYIDSFDIPQLQELLSNYGDILTIRFDAPSHIRPEQADQLLKTVLKSQPGCLVGSRLSPDVETDYFSLGAIPSAGINAPWETVADASACRWEELLEQLIDVAGKGGNLLLNVAPDSAGVLPPAVHKELNRIGQWLKKNGKAIYGVQKSPFPVDPAWGRITSKGKKLYLIVTDPLASAISLSGLRTGVLRCKLLETGKSVFMEQQHDAVRDRHRLTIRLPGSAERFRVVQVDLADEIDVSNRLEPDQTGKITLPAVCAEVLTENAARGLSVGINGVTQRWTDPRDRLQWQFTIDQTGYYDLHLTLKTGFWHLWDWDHELNLEIDDQIFGVTLADDGSPATPYGERAIHAARLWLTPGQHVLTVSPEILTSEALAGLTLMNCTLTSV